jgi:hypothetical protein
MPSASALFIPSLNAGAFRANTQVMPARGCRANPTHSFDHERIKRICVENPGVQRSFAGISWLDRFSFFPFCCSLLFRGGGVSVVD